MAYGDVAIDVTAEQLEYAVKNFDNKADKTYVDGELATKANKVDVDNELEKKASIEMVEGGLAQKRNFFTVDDTADNKTGLGFDSYSGTDVLNVKRDGDTIITDEYGNLKVNTDNIASKAYVDSAKDENKAAIETNTANIEKLETDKSNASDVAQNFANAVKGTGTGTAMAFDDVSPILHKVQISGEAGEAIKCYGRNLLPQTNYKVESGSGLTVTHNADGTITLNGTTTGNLFINLIGNRTNNSAKNPFYGFPVGFKMTGLRLLQSGTIDKTSLYLYYRLSASASATSISYNGTTYTIGLTVNEAIKNTEKIFGIYLNCPVGVTFTNAVIAPMLYYSFESDISYVPYKEPIEVILDENGNGEIDSYQNMRMYSMGNDFEASYNRDLNRLETYINNPLYSKKIALNGDSICANNGGFGKIIANNNNMTYKNKAVSGGTVAYGTVSGSSNRHWICDTVSKMSDDADYILFEGGINDYWNNVPLGAITDTMSAEIDNTTFYGALESICRQALAKWIGKKIGFVIVHKINNTWRVANANGNTFKDFHNAIVDVCNKYSIPVCDLYNNSTFNTELTEYLPYTTDDNGTGTGAGVHPTTEGYKLFYVDKIANFLKSL